MRISDWSSDVCSSDLLSAGVAAGTQSIGSRVAPQQARFFPLQGEEAGEADRPVATVAVAGADLVEQAELLEQHAVGLAHRLLGIPDVDRLGAGAVHLEDLEVLAAAERLDRPEAHIEAAEVELRHGARDLVEARGQRRRDVGAAVRSEEHTSELQSLMRISYAV